MLRPHPALLRRGPWDEGLPRVSGAAAVLRRDGQMLRRAWAANQARWDRFGREVRPAARVLSLQTLSTLSKS